MKYIVPDDLPLLDALVLFFPTSSKTTLRSWIKEGRIQLDGNPVKISSIVAAKNQEITVGNRKKFVPHQFPILYEDSDLIVIDKPSGLLSVSSNFEKGETAHAILKKYYHSRHVFVVHRLDQDTSGVMLFAFNQETCNRLKKIFEKHEIERSYTAIVEGRMTSSKGTWTSHLYEDATYRVHVTDDPEEGEEAITHYRMIVASRNYSRLELTLETGKKNQIRVHCQEAGHPIAGDKKYGARTNPIKRLCLHAHLLAFKHPISHKKMRFESPIPPEFLRLTKG